MAAMFFEKRKFPHSILFPFGQIYCILNFKSIGLTVYSLQFFQSYSATKWQSYAIFFILPKNHVINKFPKFGEDISFHSRVIAL